MVNNNLDLKDLPDMGEMSCDSEYFDNIFSNFSELSNWSITKNNENIILKWDKKLNIDIYNNTISNEKQLKNDLIYLQMAEIRGKISYSKRMKVGSLIVKNKSIISEGYNGTPSGFPNNCEDESMNTLPYVLHAEANAITKLAKGTQGSDGADIYITLSPCFECAKLIIQAGIKRIIFSEIYRNSEPIKFLIKSGIEITRIKNFKII